MRSMNVVKEDISQPCEDITSPGIAIFLLKSQNSRRHAGLYGTLSEKPLETRLRSVFGIVSSLIDPELS